MNEKDFIVIHALHKHKSITKAAKELFVSQPSLSIHIQNMEKELKVKLINRGVNGVEFTKEGEYFFQQAEEMLSQIRTIKETIINMGEDIRGVISIGGGNYTLKYKLPKFLKQFIELHPEIEFNVVSARSNVVSSMLYRQEIHFAFICTLYGWSEEKYLLDEEPLYLISKETIDFKELPKLSRIEYVTDHEFANSLDSWWNKNFKSAPKIGMKVTNIDVCKEMVRNNLGYAIVPSKVLREDDDVISMPVLNKDGSNLTRKLWMIYRTDLAEVNNISTFAKFMKENY